MILFASLLARLGQRDREQLLKKAGQETFEYCEIFGGVGAIAASNTLTFAGIRSTIATMRMASRRWP